MPVYFGDKIREARKAVGLTQRQLAEKINVSNTSVSNWEKNISRPDPDTIQNLCWVLCVQPNYFFGTDDISAETGHEKTPTSEGGRNVNDDDIKFALFGDAEIDDELYEEVKAFAKFAKERKDKRSN